MHTRISSCFTKTGNNKHILHIIPFVIFYVTAKYIDMRPLLYIILYNVSVLLNLLSHKYLHLQDIAPLRLYPNKHTRPLSPIVAEQGQILLTDIFH